MTDPKLPPLPAPASKAYSRVPNYWSADQMDAHWLEGYRAGQSAEKEAEKTRRREGIKYWSQFAHGNAEDMHTQRERDLNCPACGGSGHVDDVRQSSAEPMTRGEAIAMVAKHGFRMEPNHPVTDCIVAAVQDASRRAPAAAPTPPNAAAVPEGEPSPWAENYLREKYGAHRAHPEWRALTEAFNAGLAAASPPPNIAPEGAHDGYGTEAQEPKPAPGLAFGADGVLRPIVARTPPAVSGCQHKRYSVDTREQTGACYDCGAEGRMKFVVEAPTPPAGERCATCRDRLYEELRELIDAGSESMTHADAVEMIRMWRGMPPAGEQWIPCSERMPKHPAPYLVVVDEPPGFDSGWSLPKVAVVKFKNSGRWHEHDCLPLEEGCHVSHWMPFPTPPKGGQEP